MIVLMVSAIVIALIEDLRRQKIPNLVTFPTMALALAYHTLAAGLHGLLFSAGGLALGLLLFIIPYLMGGMGAGDVKLMAALGAIFGPKGIVVASLIVVLAGGLYGLVLMALNPRYTGAFLKRLGLTLKTFVLTLQFIPIPPAAEENRPILKFAVPIAVGALGYMYTKMIGYDVFSELLGVAL
jgi:prepilin peptidase CpaA